MRSKLFEFVQINLLETLLGNQGLAAQGYHGPHTTTFVRKDQLMATGIANLCLNANIVLSRFEGCRHPGQASNDNGPAETSDRLLHAALRHFADHGLGAAREAREEAENAFFAGDREAYDWWIAICRTLDRRIAAQLDHQFNRKLAPGS